MPKVLVLFAHPRLEKSRANKALVRRFPHERDITFVDLYERYPDGAIDIAAEQAALLAHDIIVWHHPLYWYSAPPLLKQWMDLVLSFGWAYGPGGNALRGKTVLQVVTTGGAQEAYTLEGFHGSTLKQFLRPFERTATLCGMSWLPPFAVHSTHRLTADQLDRLARHYADLLKRFAATGVPDDAFAHLTNLADAPLAGPIRS